MRRGGTHRALTLGHILPVPRPAADTTKALSLAAL